MLLTSPLIADSHEYTFFVPHPLLYHMPLLISRATKQPIKQTMDSSAREQDAPCAESDNNDQDENVQEVLHVVPAGSVGPFETYFMNTENVAENKRLPYIMMMYASLGFDVETIYPYSEILADTYVPFIGCYLIFIIRIRNYISHNSLLP